MRFYKMDALVPKSGEHERCCAKCVTTGGGMIALGAAAFCEQYDPKESGDEHLAMRPALRLQHMPLLGASRVTAGPPFPGRRRRASYAAYRPAPPGRPLKYGCRARLPTPDGDVQVRMDGPGASTSPAALAAKYADLHLSGTPGSSAAGPALRRWIPGQLPAGAAVQVRW